jgi:hypothetical protein
MAFALGVAAHDDPLAGHRQVDSHVEDVPLALMEALGLDGDAAADVAVEEMIQLFRALADGVIERLRPIETPVSDLKLKLHAPSELQATYRSATPAARALHTFLGMCTHARRTAFIVFLVGIAPLGCTQTAESIRRTTYEKDLRYLNRKTIDSTMAQLAHDTVELDDILRGSEFAPAEAQPTVIDLLASVERSTVALEGSGGFSNHPVLDRHIEAFRLDLERAREAASRTPPSYLLASSVSSFCFYCHIRSNPRR